MRVAVIVAVFIGIWSFIALAVLGVIAPAGTGADLVVATVGGIFMGVVAYFIVDRASKRARILSAVLLGLVLVAVLIFGFQTQVWAALATGLIGAVITYLVYPIITGRRPLWVKLVVVSVAAILLIAAFAVLDPVVTTTPGSVSITNVYKSDGSQVQACVITPSPAASSQAKPLVVNLTAGDSIKFIVPYHLTAYDQGPGQFYTARQAGTGLTINDQIGTTKTTVVGTSGNSGGLTIQGAEVTGQLVLYLIYQTVGQHSTNAVISGFYATNTPFSSSTVKCSATAYYTVNVVSAPLPPPIGGGGGCPGCKIT